jgi:Ca-activated chloride channel family protein
VLLCPRLVASVTLLAGAAVLGAQAPGDLAFRTGVDLVNVTVTVTGRDGRFVAGLRADDFTVYEDGQVQTLSHFSSDRVPVSLGIALDSSSSMTAEKLSAARAAIDRLLDRLGDEDELFFASFSSEPRITQTWTQDRDLVERAVRATHASGGTAILDAAAAVVPMAETGRNRKKAVLLISDGNDTSSVIALGDLRQVIRESDVLVYALGVDGTSRGAPRIVRIDPPVRFPPETSFPFPRGRGSPQFPPIREPPSFVSTSGDRVNADALRQITDDTGGRTEIVRGFDGLDDATARLADELSRQYFLGYVRNGDRDGRWHSIRVTVGDGGLTVRARRGYIAS